MRSGSAPAVLDANGGDQIESAQFEVSAGSNENRPRANHPVGQSGLGVEEYQRFDDVVESPRNGRGVGSRGRGVEGVQPVVEGRGFFRDDDQGSGGCRLMQGVEAGCCGRGGRRRSVRARGAGGVIRVQGRMGP